MTDDNYYPWIIEATLTSQVSTLLYAKDDTDEDMETLKELAEEEVDRLITLLSEKVGLDDIKRIDQESATPEKPFGLNRKKYFGTDWTLRPAYHHEVEGRDAQAPGLPKYQMCPHCLDEEREASSDS